MPNSRVPWDNGSTERSISGAGTYYTQWFVLDEAGRPPGRTLTGDEVVTGTLVGTATLQVSNTPKLQCGADNSGANASDYTALTMPAVSGAGSATFKATPRARLARFKFVYTSGSGTLAFDVTTS